MSKANGVAIAVVVAVLAIAAACLIPPGFMRGPAEDAAGLRAIVHDADARTYELPLSEDAELAVTTGLGTNVVVVQDGTVFVRDADCDNHDCIRQGAISSPGRQIICLPHELWIEVVAEGDAAGAMDVAAVAGDGAQEAFDAVAR